MRGLCIAVGLVCAVDAAAAPIQIMHQGRIWVTSGTVVNGTHDVLIRIHPDATTASVVYGDTFTTTFEDGYYSVLLGSNPSLPLSSASLATGTDLWVSVTLDGIELPPRQRLAVVPRAAVAYEVAGGSVAASSVTVQGSGVVTLGRDSGTTCTVAGSLVYDTTLNLAKVCVGTSWLAIGAERIVESANGRVWSDGSMATSCKEYRTPTLASRLYQGATGDGTYRIDPDGDNVGGFTAWCDMTTDGGGWTVVHSVNGADGQQPLVSDVEVFGDPATYGQYNLSRSKKMLISAISTQTLFLQNNNTWLRANRATFDNTLSTASSHAHYSVTLTSSNGTSAAGVMGWSNYNYLGGGDFGLTTTAGFDHHSATYNHLNNSCNNQYLYSASTPQNDSDAGYDVRIALGDWTGTLSCDGAEGGALVFRTAMR